MTWVETVEGFSGIGLQHLYRTNGFLAEVREDMAKALFSRDRHLFSQELDVVFLDTTSICVYRAEETDWRKRGCSRDHRPDLSQLVPGVAVDRKGWPVSWEVFPGNTADPAAFAAMITKIRQRFRIGRVVVAADRGMMGKKSLELLATEKAPYEYILGCRMRKQKEIGTEVLTRAGRYQEVAENLKVKEVVVGDNRYIICLNEEEERKDEAAREAILAYLREKLRGGAKSLVANKGYARYLRVTKGAMRIDEEAVAGFLALRLEVDLQQRLMDRNLDVAWPTLMRDLGRVQAVRVEADGQFFVLRTDLQGTAHQAFQTAGVRPPSSVTMTS